VMTDADESDFQAKVIERSASVPVVVDFWAEWCGPCRSLGPVLEREVAAMNGKVELVKVDTDKSPRLAREYQIRGIPAVKAFKNGKVIDEFVGAQPAPLVREFLATLAPSEAQLKQEQAFADAKAALLAGRLSEVEPLLAEIDPRGPFFTEVEAMRNVLALAAAADEYGGMDKARAQLAAQPDDLEARYAVGAGWVGQGKTGEALEQFLEIVTRSRKFRDDAGRRAMVTLFEQPGVDAELVREYRRRLQIVT
jgi:putative thioredoxin